MTSANQMFTNCGSLETIYATSFSNLGLSGSLMFNSCNRLVGGTDGFVPSTTSRASVCKLGAGGVLTNPNDDRRTWFWGHFYADGEGVLTATSTPGCHARARRIRANLRQRQVRGAGLHALGRRHRSDAPPAPHERDLRERHGGLLVFELQLPVLLVHQSGECERPGQPLGRALDALHVQLLRVHDDRLPGLRPVGADGPVLHVLGLQQARHDLCECDMGIAFGRPHGLAVLLLVLDLAVGDNGSVWASNKAAYTYFRIDTASTPGYITAA